jgi:hypothetical protein
MLFSATKGLALHDSIPFQLMTSKVLKQAKPSDGIIDYAAKASFPFLLGQAQF